MTQTVEQMVAHLVRRESEVVLKALRSRVGDDARLESLAGRLHQAVTPAGSTYLLDDVPFIWVGTPKIERDEETGTISADREWREL